MIVYRCEDFRGEGPYRNNGYETIDINLDILRPFFDGNYHPTPWLDNLGSLSDQWFCGFKNPEQWFGWFFARDMRAALYERGFYLWSFTIPESLVKVGGHQCLFKRHSAIRAVRPLDTPFAVDMIGTIADIGTVAANT